MRNSTHSRLSHYHLPFWVLPFLVVTTSAISEIIQKERESSTKLLLPHAVCWTKIKSILHRHSFTAEWLRTTSSKLDEHWSSIQLVHTQPVICPVIAPSLPLSLSQRKLCFLHLFFRLCVCSLPLAAPQVLAVMFQVSLREETWPNTRSGERARASCCFLLFLCGICDTHSLTHTDRKREWAREDSISQS